MRRSASQLVRGRKPVSLCVLAAAWALVSGCGIGDANARLTTRTVVSALSSTQCTWIGKEVGYLLDDPVECDGSKGYRRIFRCVESCTVVAIGKNIALTAANCVRNK